MLGLEWFFHYVYSCLIFNSTFPLIYKCSRAKSVLIIFLNKSIYFNWRLITLQYCDFCHTLTWISHRCTCVPPSQMPLPPLSPSHPSGMSLYQHNPMGWHNPLGCILGHLYPWAHNRWPQRPGRRGKQGRVGDSVCPSQHGQDGHSLIHLLSESDSVPSTGGPEGVRSDLWPQGAPSLLGEAAE